MKSIQPIAFQKMSDDACVYVRRHKREIIDRFAGNAFPPSKNLISIFMAGSPGAGKTEFSKSFIQAMHDEEHIEPIVRIDGDEIRDMLPGYTGSNSSIFQPAISIGVEKLHDYVLEKKKNFILDGTFSHIDKARSNIIRSLNAHRKIFILYMYQDPIVSWKFTRKREVIEGRKITKEIFIEQFFSAREVTQAVKDEFGDKIVILLIERNLETEQRNYSTDIQNIDSRISVKYSKKELQQLLPI